MGALPHHGSGPSPFCQPRFAEEVTRWLQARATPEERARYARYMGRLQDAAAAAAARDADAAHLALFGTPRPAPSAATTARTARRTPRWGALPDAAAPAALEAAARRARAQLASAPGGHGKSLRASPAGVHRPASAAPPQSWLHTATLAAQRRPGTSVAAPNRAPVAAAVAPDAVGPARSSGGGLRLQLDSIVAGHTAAAAQGGGVIEGPPSTAAATARISERAAAMAAAPPAPKGGALDITTAMAAFGLKDLYPDLWANTLPICRPEAAPNRNFRSEW
jgi:hypothetical protein